MKRLIAEFQRQIFTQIIFPHEKTDWKCCLKDAKKTFVNIVNEIIKYQKCLVICNDVEYVKNYFTDNKNLYFKEYETDDTWARDISAISVEENNEIKLLNFTFNGWGAKFEAFKDDKMTEKIMPNAIKCDFILEGGAIDCNGDGIILTTSKCMLNKNRNSSLDVNQITQKLKDFFNAEHILYLNHGYLAGDDTDSHIDTLARFISKESIMYVKCDDINDEHYHELKLMEEELQMIAKEQNLQLIALPMCDALYFEGERLPATYANFLFVNGAVLVPTYGVSQDKKALEIFKNTFHDRDIIGIDCSVLIRQHGSLHCVSMNFPANVSV